MKFMSSCGRNGHRKKLLSGSASLKERYRTNWIKRHGRTGCTMGSMPNTKHMCEGNTLGWGVIRLQDIQYFTAWSRNICSMTSRPRCSLEGSGHITESSRLFQEEPSEPSSRVRTAEKSKLIETSFGKEGEVKENENSSSWTNVWSTKDPSTSRTEEESVMLRETSSRQGKVAKDCCSSVLTGNRERHFLKRYFLCQSTALKMQSVESRSDFRNSSLSPSTTIFCSFITKHSRRNSRSKYISAILTLRGKSHWWRTETNSYENIFPRDLIFRSIQSHTSKSSRRNCNDASWNVYITNFQRRFLRNTGKEKRSTDVLLFSWLIDLKIY